jgi:hypothetical protein
MEQGCPISPLLFNICIEPLLRRLHSCTEKGHKTQSEFLKEGVSSSVLAYADDLILISETEDDMCNLLEHLDDFCNYARIEVNPVKSLTPSLVWFQEGGGCRTLAPYLEPGLVREDSFPPVSLDFRSVWARTYASIPGRR